MAEPTLKDVLGAIAEIRGGVARLDAKVTAYDARFDALDAKVDAHGAETANGFAELDKELTRHADVHRELEKDVATLKRRPPRTAARPGRRR